MVPEVKMSVIDGSTANSIVQQENAVMVQAPCQDLVSSLRVFVRESNTPFN